MSIYVQDMSWNLQILPYMAKDVIKSRILGGGACPRLSRWVLSPMPRSLGQWSGGRPHRWKRRGRQAPTSQWIPETARIQKGRESMLSWASQRKHGPNNTLTLDFWLSELWRNKFLLFKATKLVIIYCSSLRKLIHNPEQDPGMRLEGLLIRLSINKTKLTVPWEDS